MLNKLRKSLLPITIFVLTFGLILTVYSWMQTDVSFKNETVEFSLSGTYTKNIYKDGTHKWEPSNPNTGTLTVWGTAQGTGHAFVEIVSGNVYMHPVAPSRDGGQIGVMRRSRQVPLIPVTRAEKGKCITTTDTLTSLPLGTGTYSWNAIGKFETQGARYGYITGWSNKSPTFYSERGDGTWTIAHQKMCSECDKAVNDFNDHLEATCTQNDWCNESNVYSCTHECSSGSDDDDDDDDDDEKICNRKVLRRFQYRNAQGIWVERTRRVTCGERFTDENNDFGDCEPGRKHAE